MRQGNISENSQYTLYLTPEGAGILFPIAGFEAFPANHVSLRGVFINGPHPHACRSLRTYCAIPESKCSKFVHKVVPKRLDSISRNHMLQGTSDLEGLSLFEDGEHEEVQVHVEFYGNLFVELFSRRRETIAKSNKYTLRHFLGGMLCHFENPILGETKFGGIVCHGGENGRGTFQ